MPTVQSTPVKILLKFLRSKKFIFTALALFIGTTIFVFAVNIYILNASSAFIFKNTKDVPSKAVALVLGARVYADGRLSDILKDRELTALELYEQGKVQKILVSGDHGNKEYDEVKAMKNFLLQKGVRAEDIFLDHAGFDTYDSIYRAKAIFQVPSLIIVSQDFHLPRALYLAKSLGLDAVGIVANRQKYVSENYNGFRESFSRIKSFLDIALQAKPKFLGTPIPISGDSRASWGS